MITELGYLVIPISILVLIFKPQWLLYLTVFFSTFTASSIINIESTRTGIQPVYFVGSLWLLYVSLKNIREIFFRKKKTINDLIKMYDKKMIVGLISFTLVTFFSIFMPILLEGKFEVLRPNKGSEVIQFSSSNITQFIYLLFMILISFSIIVEVKDKKKIDTVLKVFIFSCLFACFWGLLQFLVNYLGMRYPHELFNNNISYSQQYGQTILSIKRINSIAVEPSMFALNLVGILPILAILWLSEFEIFSNRILNEVFFIFNIIFTTVIALLTTSSSAYLGIAIVFILSILVVFRLSLKNGKIYKNKYKVKRIIIIGIISVIFICGIMIFKFGISIDMLNDVIKTVTVDKMNNQSGLDRFAAMKQSLELFKNSPILGIGWGSYRSYDLFTNLLALTGILGFGSFLMYIIYAIISALKSITRYNEGYKYAFIISIIATFSILMIGIPDLTFAYIWIFITLAGFKGDLI